MCDAAVGHPSPCQTCVTRLKTLDSSACVPRVFSQVRKIPKLLCPPSSWQRSSYVASLWFLWFRESRLGLNIWANTGGSGVSIMLWLKLRLILSAHQSSGLHKHTLLSSGSVPASLSVTFSHLQHVSNKLYNNDSHWEEPLLKRTSSVVFWFETRPVIWTIVD